MPSLDIVNQIDVQEIDNAINNMRKEVATRYDFRNIPTEIAFDKKEKKIVLTSGDDTKLSALREMLFSNAAKRHVDLKVFKFGTSEPASGASRRLAITILEGIDKEVGKKIVKLIKDTKLKVQPSIQGETVRISGKNIDDLQAVMAMLRESKLEVPVQFINMKRD